MRKRVSTDEAVEVLDVFPPTELGSRQHAVHHHGRHEPDDEDHGDVDRDGVAQEVSQVHGALPRT
jgi:hypothetical protein